MSKPRKTFFTRLSPQPIDLCFLFRPVKSIDTPHFKPNFEGQVMVNIRISGVDYGDFPTEIWTTTAIWEDRHMCQPSPEAIQLKEALSDYHYVLLESWDCLAKEGFTATGELVFKGRQRESGFIRTALSFGARHLYWSLTFWFLPPPTGQLGYMVVTIDEANATTYGPYCTEIQTTRAQAAAFRPGLPLTPDQVTLKNACYALCDRIREEWPYFSITPTPDHASRVENSLLGLGLTPLIRPGYYSRFTKKTDTDHA